MGRITGSLDYSDLKNTDMILECVSENFELKKKIFGPFSDLPRSSNPWTRETCPAADLGPTTRITWPVITNKCVHD